MLCWAKLKECLPCNECLCKKTYEVDCRYKRLGTMMISFKITVLWDVTMCILVGRYHCFKETSLHLQSYTLKIWDCSFLQNAVTLLQGYTCHTLEDSNLNIYYHEDFKSYILTVSVSTIVTDLDRGEWSAAYSGCLTTTEWPPCSHALEELQSVPGIWI